MIRIYVFLWLISVLFGMLTAQSIHGFVKDGTSNEPLYLVNVWIEGHPIGSSTNIKGYYVLSGLPADEVRVHYSYIGYQDTVISIRTVKGKSIRVDISLIPKALQEKEIITYGDREQNNLDIRSGQMFLTSTQIKEMPQIAEPDLFRSFQMMPGVATLSDFSAGLYIRGGSPDQNLILLDQIDVYNPNHMFGFFSTFNSDAVKSVELLKGGFPAQFGGRLSSVMNVQNKEGNRKEFEGIARISLLSSSLTIEGPWKKGSWMLSGRRTYLDLAGKIINQEIPYYFYDGHGKINYDMNENNQMTLSFYLGDDNLDISSESTSIELGWGNRTFSANWMHLFSPKLYSNFVIAGSQFKSDTRVAFDDVEFGLLNKITDFSLKGNLKYAPDGKHTIDLGSEFKALTFRLNNIIVSNTYKNEYSGYYLAGFVQDNIHITPSNILQTGLRLSHYTDGDYTRVEPRISYKHLFSPVFSFTATYGKYYQYLNLVHREGLSFADIWFPVDNTFEPGEADHFLIGFNYDTSTNFSVEAEFYYKKYHNLAEYREYRNPDEPLEDQTAAQNFYKGTGKSYGMDVLIRNNIKGFSGWLGYSFGWVKKKTEGYNFGEEYYPTYDRRHTFTLVENVRIPWNWRLSIAFKYGTGQPFTQPTAVYTVTDPDGSQYRLPLEGKKNFYRLPDYYRLDLGLFKTTKIRGIPIEFYVQVINVLNTENVWFRRFDTTENPVRIEDESMLPRIPTVGMAIPF